MKTRHGRDMGEMRARYGRGMGEIWARYGEIWAHRLAWDGAEERAALAQAEVGVDGERVLVRLGAPGDRVRVGVRVRLGAPGDRVIG